MNEVIHTLWDRGTEVTEVSDPYSFLAKTRGLVNYKFFTVASLQFPYLDKLPDHVRKFIIERPRVLGIANWVVLQDKVVISSITFRDLKEKDFCTYSILSGFPYGLGQLTDFKYGDPLVVVEGLKDRDSLTQICPNTVALTGSSMGRVMKEILLTVTNNFILLYDNDETGHKQSRHDKYGLEHCQCKVSLANHPEGFKDAGEVTDNFYLGDSSTAEYLLSYHKSQLKILGAAVC